MNSMKLAMLQRLAAVLVIYSFSIGIGSVSVLGQKMARQDKFQTSIFTSSGTRPEGGGVCEGTKLQISGDSSATDDYGNIRTYNADEFNANASAFSRRKSDGLWETAYLSLKPGGVGVTDRGEGTGSGGADKIDNSGDRNNYVVFEFDRNVVFDEFLLDDVTNDSDISVWIGTANNPFVNHLTLSDALLNSFGPSEQSEGTNASARLADVNASNRVGNVVVLAGSTTSVTQNDFFRALVIGISCPPPPPPPPGFGSVKIIKQVLTVNGVQASTQSFSFNATGIGVPSFALVDNNVVGPDRFLNDTISLFGPTNPITVTEIQPFGWSLGDLECTETGTQNTTVNFLTGTANIIVDAGESVVCTFTNVQFTPTAANVSISGRALRSDLRGASGATVTILDATTGQMRYSRTNTFGYYTFDEIEIGKVYVVSISHKQIQFAPESQTVSISEDLRGLDFIQVQ